ncbi:unnamed protein product [Haemonchus placei]|uniref:DUF1758 domain-containing protein n=1 Tax=Haemonchus placei TaxID=6290 RepID=A0A0N4WMT1_HAEPC|nr:unnamed protein product [Haemonchus placei]
MLEQVELDQFHSGSALPTLFLGYVINDHLVPGSLPEGSLCGLCCYVGCPPTPGSIARKLAFHPPKKGVSYTVHLADNPRKIIKGADELEGQKFFITPTPLEMTTVFDYERLLDRTKVSCCVESKYDTIDSRNISLVSQGWQIVGRTTAYDLSGTRTC